MSEAKELIAHSGGEIRNVRSERRMRDSLSHFTFLFSRFPVGRLLRFASNYKAFVEFCVSHIIE